MGNGYLFNQVKKANPFFLIYHSNQDLFAQDDMDQGKQNVGVGDKVSGVVGMMVGKMTGDKTKVEESRDKRDGKTIFNPSNTSAHDAEPAHADTHHPDHPGISYTSKGAMKQRNMQPPPSSKVEDAEFARARDHPGIGYTKSGAMRQPNIRPPPSTEDPSANESTSTPEPGSDSKPTEGWSTETTAEYNFGNNFDVHPHVNYAGPNLTRVIPPPNEEDEQVNLARIEEQGQHDYDLLYGGFPTGAPSPGIRPRSAEVVDRFDRG